MSIKIETQLKIVVDGDSIVLTRSEAENLFHLLSIELKKTPVSNTVPSMFFGPNCIR